ncbi:MAG: hypothetical protein FWD66_01140 [Paludibacter sp.]|nr:hypothetical protein [Paludibacter sp.]
MTRKRHYLFEFLEGENGRLSSKRLIGMFFAICSLVVALVLNNDILTGIFIGGALGESIGSTFDKRIKDD